MLTRKPKQPDGKVIEHQILESEYELTLDDVDYTPNARIDELPKYGKPRRNPFKAKPAPTRPGKCLHRRALPGDLPGVSLNL